MKRFAGLLLSLAAACTSSTRALSPVAKDPASIDEIASAANAFGLGLLRSESQTRARDANILVSPATNYLALSMLVPGTQGKARESLDQVLRVPRNLEDYLIDVANLRRQLGNAATRSESQLKIANRVFVEESDLKVSDRYKKALRDGWETDPSAVAFRADPEAARSSLNKVISSDTNSLIPEAFAPGSITKDSLLALSSALYFKAGWDVAFPKSLTVKRRFITGPGEKSKRLTTMARRNAYLDYLETPRLRWLRLPYRRGDFHLILGIPKKAKEDSVRNLLDEVPVAGFRGLDWKAQLVNLRLPRFKLDSGSLDMKASFVEAGLTPVFVPVKGDFTPLSSGLTLNLQSAAHRVALDVDEQGSEAAAVTALSTKGAAAIRKEKLKASDYFVERAFLFFLEHESSGLILLSGIVGDPKP